jgi:signal transduction histidine kinase
MSVLTRKHRLPVTLMPPRLRADEHTERLYRWFNVCHMVAGLLALALAAWVYETALRLTPDYWLFLALATTLLLQPIMFRLTGAYHLLSAMSIVILNTMILLASYNFGGHLSPALPVSIVVPLLCLFFLSTLGQYVGLSVLAACYGILITLFVNGHTFPQNLPPENLPGLFMAGVVVAAVLVAAIAWAYLDLYALSRDSLRREVERHRDTANSLAKAQNLAAQSARVKGQSIAAVCDEIRMPLNAIIGFAQIISREMMGQLSNERYRSCASDIESSGRHLLGVIDEVLDLVHAETGELEITDGDFDLAELVAVCTQSIATLAQARDVRLDTNVPKNGMQVRADHGRIRQVIVALISNGIVLAGGGGHLQIRLSLTAAGDIMLLIRATGSTVSLERIASATELADDIAASQGAERLGNGYGLPVARKLIELHGGKLQIGGPKPDESHIILTLPPGRLL